MSRRPGAEFALGDLRVGDTIRVQYNAVRTDVLHVRGIVDDRLLLRQWLRTRRGWLYRVEDYNWWTVNRPISTIERKEDR